VEKGYAMIALRQSCLENIIAIVVRYFLIEILRMNIGNLLGTFWLLLVSQSLLCLEISFFHSIKSAGIVVLKKFSISISQFSLPLPPSFEMLDIESI
jgi:hypothetical protein